jgi:hypothetical protein
MESGKGHTAMKRETFRAITHSTVVVGLVVVVRVNVVAP